MSACRLRETQLWAWLDEAAGPRRAAAIAAHAALCMHCHAKTIALHRAQERLRELLDAEMQPCEPLVVWQQIQARMVARRAAAWGSRLASAWLELWLWQRRRALALALCLSVGVGLSAGLAGSWLGRPERRHHLALRAPVAVERLQLQPHLRARIEQRDEHTTLIWVEAVGP